MNLDFSGGDVRQHLESLGYNNITEDQLKDFVRDLRRLIRYEEKQKKLQKLIIEERQRSNINQDDGDDENDDSDARDEVDKNDIKIKRRGAVYRDFQKETKVKKVLTKQRNTVKYNKNTGDISVTNDSVSLSYEESNSSCEQEVQGNINKKWVMLQCMEGKNKCNVCELVITYYLHNKVGSKFNY